MGFLDKVQQAAKQGQDKLDDLAAKKKADGLLRDLGAWHYAKLTVSLVCHFGCPRGPQKAIIAKHNIHQCITARKFVRQVPTLPSFLSISTNFRPFGSRSALIVHCGVRRRRSRARQGDAFQEVECLVKLVVVAAQLVQRGLGADGAAARR